MITAINSTNEPILGSQNITVRPDLGLTENSTSTQLIPYVCDIGFANGIPAIPFMIGLPIGLVIMVVSVRILYEKKCRASLKQRTTNLPAI